MEKECKSNPLVTALWVQCKMALGILDNDKASLKRYMLEEAHSKLLETTCELYDNAHITANAGAIIEETKNMLKR